MKISDITVQQILNASQSEPEPGTSLLQHDQGVITGGNSAHQVRWQLYCHIQRPLLHHSGIQRQHQIHSVHGIHHINIPAWRAGIFFLSREQRLAVHRN